MNDAGQPSMATDADASQNGETARHRAAARWLVVAALVVGAGLRIHHFDRPGLWIDEYGTWWVVAAESWAGVATRAWEVQGQSPLYYLLARAFTQVLGFSSWSLRLPSLLLGVATLALAVRLARELFRDPRVAGMAAVALALHAPLIRYSQEARPYALALALSVASFIFFLRMLRGKTGAVPVAYAITTAGAFYAHYLFGFTWAVQAAYALCRRRALERSHVVALGVAGVLSAPGAFQLANLFARRSSLDWAAEASGVFRASWSVAGEMLDILPFGLASALVIALVFAGTRVWRPGDDDRPGLLALWLLLPFAVVALLPALIGVHLVHTRYLLFCAPAARIAVGAVLAMPRGRGPLDYLPLAAFTIASCYFVLWPYYLETGTFADRKDQRWDAAVAELVAGYRDGDRVLLSTRFVEMDAIVAGIAPETIREFAMWPLVAHLPDDAGLDFTPLPYRVDAATRPILDATLRDAFAVDRVWLLGAGPSVDYIGRVVARNPRLRITRNDRYGTVQLIRIER